MKIYIDTSSNEKTVIRLDDKELIQDSKIWRSQAVLPMIERLLIDNGHKISELTEVEVFCGPGSYTGLRVGIAIANALGYGLGIPVNGQKITDKNFLRPRYEN